MPPFEFKSVVEDGKTIIFVDERLVTGNRDDLKKLAVEKIDGGAKELVLDFSETSYVDSSGLGALVSMNKKARDKGASLELRGLNKNLKTLMEQTRLHTVLKIA